MSDLSPKQKRFIAEYLANGLNATKAAISAGYSKKTADTQAARLLVNVKVAEVISKKTEKIMTKLDISVERTLNEVGRLAFLDVRNLFEPDGSLKQIDKLDDDSAACIAGLEVSDIWDAGEGEQKSIIGTLKKVKLADKGAALDKLMRYHSLYKDKVEVSGLESLAEAISRARKRNA
ncbi:MAG TPA: terminase small subunit [Terriglobales bacterium]|nr:terminase small subunit [Terriglobales bacterium]